MGWQSVSVRAGSAVQEAMMEGQLTGRDDLTAKDASCIQHLKTSIVPPSTPKFARQIFAGQEPPQCRSAVVMKVNDLRLRHVTFTSRQHAHDQLMDAACDFAKSTEPSLVADNVTIGG